MAATSWSHDVILLALFVEPGGHEGVESVADEVDCAKYQEDQVDVEGEADVLAVLDGPGEDASAQGRRQHPATRRRQHD